MSNAVDAHSLTTEQAAEPAHAFPRRTVLQSAVDIASPEEILAYLTACMEQRRGCSVVGISAPYATAMSDSPALREAFLKADLLVPDGKGFTWGARMLGVPCGERLAIPDLCEQLLAYCGAHGLKVFIYGATEAVNAQACENVRARFPGIAVVAGQHGYNQGAAEEDSLIARFRDEQFHLLIVARPSPDKEHFLERCCKPAGVVGLAAGGYADVLAGKTRRAPQWVQSAGMEWLYRTVQEPGRLWKRVGWANARFASAVLWQHLKNPAPRPWWGSRTIQLAAIVLAITAGYVGALNAPYHFDDPEYIQHNPTIRSFKALSGITVLARRKLWWVSNAICYKLSELFGNHRVDSPDVRVFRLWNIACHFIAALALLGLLRRCLRAAGYIPDGPGGRGTPYDLAAFAAAALFAAHPLCTESVTYISGRDNGQGGMFYLLGLYFSAIFFERLAQVPAGLALRRASAWPGWIWPFVAMLISGGCAVLTKENYLVMPLSVVLVYFFFFRGNMRRTVSLGLLGGIVVSILILAWAAAGRHDGYLGPAAQLIIVVLAAGGLLGHDAVPSRSGVRALLQRRCTVGWALAIGIAGLSLASLVAFPYAYQRTFAALAGEENSDYVRSLCTQAYAVPQMLLQTVVPYRLNIDHDFPSISDPHDPRVLHGALILGALLLLGLAGIYRGWLGSFGILLALLTVAPSNSVIERGDIVSERNFYLAAAGGACVIAWIIALLTAGIMPRFRAGLKRELPASGRGSLAALQEAGLWAGTLACCIAGPFTSYTLLRNQEWSNPLLLWEAARKESPKKIRVLYNLGVTYAALKRYDDADFCFTNAIEVGEYKVENNLFRQDEAVEIKCFHLAYINLANMHLLRYMKSGAQGDYAPLNRIDEIFKKGLERTTYDPDLALAYAQFQHDLGRYYQAVPKLQKALELHTWAEQLYFPLGVALIETGDTAGALQRLTQATQIHERHTLGVEIDQPDENRSDTYAFLGEAQFLSGDSASASASLEKALTLDPHGGILVLQISQRIWNPNLRPVEINPPDVFLQALTKTRRDFLMLMRDCDARVRLLNVPTVVRNRTLLENLHACIETELRRRATIQEKRVKMGFKDDPDDMGQAH